MSGKGTETMFTPEEAVDLEGPEVTSTWNAAHRGILKLFKRKLKMLLRLEPKNYLILVAGGSSHNRFMRKEMQDICDQLGVPAEKLIFTDHVDTANK